MKTQTSFQIKIFKDGITLPTVVYSLVHQA